MNVNVGTEADFGMHAAIGTSNDEEDELVIDSGYQD